MKTYLLIFLLLITFNIQDNGNWWLNDGTTLFTGEWFSEHTYMKVSGTDGTCYWLHENDEGLIQSDCDMKSISIMLYK